jgi:LDH2 family malate/lactate/ureidoglycolate dehydrogenase
VVHVDASALREFAAEVLCAGGLPTDSAAIVADALVSADLRGVDTHGVCRIPVYIERLGIGGVDTNPKMTFERRSDSAGVLDGCNGMGMLVGVRAVKETIALAKKTGVATVTVRGANHFGALGYYTMQIAREGYIGALCSNAPSTMAPWGGKVPFLGTNPFSVAIPRGEGQNPIVLDMSGSVVARGKIILAEQTNGTIPEGWALDSDGNPTSNPQDALAGTVLPFGGYKGYGVVLLIEVLAGLLSGSRFAPNVGGLYGGSTDGQDIGAFMSAIDVGTFGVSKDEFYERLTALSDGIHASDMADGVQRIFLPGEIEQETSEKRREEGIPVPPGIVTELRQVARELKVDASLFDS